MGFLQYCGNLENTVCFSSPNLVIGSPGSSLISETVYFPITLVPKYTSFANFTASTPALDSPFSLGCHWKKTSTVCSQNCFVYFTSWKRNSNWFSKDRK